MTTVPGTIALGFFRGFVQEESATTRRETLLDQYQIETAELTGRLLTMSETRVSWWWMLRDRSFIHRLYFDYFSFSFRSVVRMYLLLAIFTCSLVWYRSVDLFYRSLYHDREQLQNASDKPASRNTTYNTALQNQASTPFFIHKIIVVVSILAFVFPGAIAPIYTWRVYIRALCTIDFYIRSSRTTTRVSSYIVIQQITMALIRTYIHISTPFNLPHHNVPPTKKKHSPGQVGN